MNQQSLQTLFQEKERIKKKIMSLERTLEKRKEEFQDLATAIKVFEKHLGISLEETQQEDNKTIMQMIIEILTCYPEGLASNQVLEKIHEKYEPNLERTSMSPQLSRLKDREKIQYIENKWFLIKENGVERGES